MVNSEIGREMADKFLPQITCPNCQIPNITEYSSHELNILKEAGKPTGEIQCEFCGVMFIYYPAEGWSELVG